MGQPETGPVENEPTVWRCKTCGVSNLGSILRHPETGLCTSCGSGELEELPPLVDETMPHEAPDSASRDDDRYSRDQAQTDALWTGILDLLFASGRSVDPTMPWATTRFWGSVIAGMSPAIRNWLLSNGADVLMVEAVNATKDQWPFTEAWIQQLQAELGKILQFKGWVAGTDHAPPVDGRQRRPRWARRTGVPPLMSGILQAAAGAIVVLGTTKLIGLLRSAPQRADDPTDQASRSLSDFVADTDDDDDEPFVAPAFFIFDGAIVSTSDVSEIRIVGEHKVVLTLKSGGECTEEYPSNDAAYGRQYELFQALVGDTGDLPEPE